MFLVSLCVVLVVLQADLQFNHEGQPMKIEGALVGDITLSAGRAELWVYAASADREGWSIRVGEREEREDGSVIMRLDQGWCAWITPARESGRLPAGNQVDSEQLADSAS